MANGYARTRILKKRAAGLPGVARRWPRMGLAAAILCAAGCIERTVTINTEPEGARIFLNDQEVGQSPVKVPFTWYGDYDVIVRMKGYETVKANHRLHAPWYQWPGIDVFAECLVPFTIRDDRVLETYVLRPVEAPPKEALLNDAAEMREQALSAE